jgi:hypothetical protein
MPSSDQMKMQMEYALAGIWAGIDHQAVTALVHPLLTCDLPRDEGHFANQVNVAFFQLIQGCDVLVRHNKNMHRRYWMGIFKCGYLIIVIKELAIHLPGNDLAENAIWKHQAFSPRI